MAPTDVDVADWQFDLDRFAFVERRLGQFDQLVVERLVQTVVLRTGVIDRLAGGVFGDVENAAVVKTARLPVFDALLHIQEIGAADQVVELADAHLRHQFAQFFGNEEEVVDDVLRLAGELGAQHRILRRDADRAGVEMALAHHDAA